MEHLLLILILGIVGAGAIGAYELLDAIERDEYLDPTRAAERARAIALEAVPTMLPRVSTPQPSAELWYVSPQRRGAGSEEADADWLDGRIRGLEERLDRLERACLRIETLTRGAKSS
jgi:hypothetical protein